jgi:hypothetical protein
MSAPYRNEIDALRERKATLEAELAGLREQTASLDALRARTSDLAGELARVDGRLTAGGAKQRALPMLDQVRVASPCTADWNEMVGDERVRFCAGCAKNVYNISSMPKDDAEALLRASLGDDLCVRFYQRADGTILTQDCPVGVTKKRRKALVLAVAGAAGMAAGAATMFVKGSPRPVDARHLVPTATEDVVGIRAARGAPSPSSLPTIPEERVVMGRMIKHFK